MVGREFTQTMTGRHPAYESQVISPAQTTRSATQSLPLLQILLSVEARLCRPQIPIKDLCTKLHHLKQHAELFLYGTFP